MENINPIVIFVASIFTSNMILSNFLGMCSVIAVSDNVKTSFGLGQAVTFVMTFTTIINYIIYDYILVPFDMVYLRYIVFIVSIAAFVQLVEMILEKYLPSLYNSLGIFLPLITVNCAILGVSLFTIIREYSLVQTMFFGLGSGIGWTMAITALAGLKEKVKMQSVPNGLRGPGITIIIVGIMALAFLGFSGILPIG